MGDLGSDVYRQGYRLPLVNLGAAIAVVLAIVEGIARILARVIGVVA